ncbi:MAG: uroporphyrinogen decarboxylase family protein [Clostridia bacterium]
MMNSRERVIATLEHKNPDQIPVDIWFHKATTLQYGEQLQALLDGYQMDLVRVVGPMDRHFYSRTFEEGEYVDEWGSEWQVLQGGMIGEVKKPALESISQAREYQVPIELLKSEWNRYNEQVDNKIKEVRSKNQFSIGGYVEVFQRMQFIRGTENMYYDLGDLEEELYLLRDKITDYFVEYVQYWLEKDVDAIGFYDDWGSQRSLLISPAMWKNIFKPVYKKLIEMIKAKGKYVFFHSDGYILDLYPEFIELGVDAINSQVWCIGIDKVAEVAKKYAGKITFWGEIDRQNILAFGTVEEVYEASKIMKDKLCLSGGGLIGQSVAGKDVSLEKIKALLNCWNSK